MNTRLILSAQLMYNELSKLPEKPRVFMFEFFEGQIGNPPDDIKRAFDFSVVGENFDKKAVNRMQSILEQLLKLEKDDFVKLRKAFKN